MYKGPIGAPISVPVGNLTSYALKSSAIEYFPDGEWFWTVSSIIDGQTYNRPYPQYDALLKISKYSATDFIYPNPDQCTQGSVKIHQSSPSQVFNWKEVTGAVRYAIRIGVGHESGPYWYAVSLIYAPNINIIPSLYDMLPDHTYLYLSLSGTALPGSQSQEN